MLINTVAEGLTALETWAGLEECDLNAANDLACALQSIILAIAGSDPLVAEMYDEYQARLDKKWKERHQ